MPAIRTSKKRTRHVNGFPWILSLVAACSVIVSARCADRPKPGPEHKKMEACVGKWSGELPAVPTPFEPNPGTLKTEISNRMILGGFFLESRASNTYHVNGEVINVEELYIMGYDPLKKTYTRHRFVDFGGSDSWPVTVEGNTWTHIDKGTHEGKAYTVRATDTFSPDGQTLTLAAEYSLDGEDAWKPWFKGALKRVSTEEKDVK